MMKKRRKIRWPQVYLLLAFLCLCLSGCREEEEVVFFSQEMEQQECQTTFETQEDAQQVQLIQVYICGAVKHPGVYTLAEGSRMKDAVEAAGGFTEEAEDASLNLAAKIADEEMIYVYTREQIEEGGYIPVQMTWAQENGLVNINTADVNALCSLPGIGESKARDIITYREKNGTFQKKEDIMKVSGIKENLYQKICELISVK